MAAIVRFFITAGIFFLIDCMGLGTSYSLFFCFSRAFFYALIVEKKPLYQILIVGFLALMPTFLRTGIWGADLVCMIPIALALSFIARVTHMPFLLRVLLVCASLFLHALIIDILWSCFPFASFMALWVMGIVIVSSLLATYCAR